MMITLKHIKYEGRADNLNPFKTNNMIMTAFENKRIKFLFKKSEFLRTDAKLFAAIQS